MSDFQSLKNLYRGLAPRDEEGNPKRFREVVHEPNVYEATGFCPSEMFRTRIPLRDQ